MRKVQPKDEIPVKQLTMDTRSLLGIQQLNRKEHKLILKQMKQLEKYFKTLIGATVDTQEMMQRIYKLTDYYMEFASRNLVCRKGCAWCCKVPVEVSALEASYISQMTKHKANPQTQKVIRYEPDRVLDYCPLLDQEKGLCSVYQYRPLSCRVFGTYDHYFHCENPNTSHAVHSVASQPYMQHLMNNLLMWSQESDYAAVADIRDWFS